MKSCSLFAENHNHKVETNLIGGELDDATTVMNNAEPRNLLKAPKVKMRSFADKDFKVFKDNYPVFTLSSLFGPKNSQDGTDKQE